MSVNNSPRGQMNRDRYAELKNILEERRREIMSAVHEKIRDVRTEGANSPTHGVLDAAEAVQLRRLGSLERGPFTGQRAFDDCCPDGGLN